MEAKFVSVWDCGEIVYESDCEVDLDAMEITELYPSELVHGDLNDGYEHEGNLTEEYVELDDGTRYSASLDEDTYMVMDEYGRGLVTYTDDMLDVFTSGRE